MTIADSRAGPRFNNSTSFAGGDIAADGTFSVVASNGAIIAGAVHNDDKPATCDDDEITATIRSQTVTGVRSSSFGPSDDILGRFTGTALSTAGSSVEVKIVVVSQNRILFIVEDGSGVRGSYRCSSPQIHHDQ